MGKREGNSTTRLSPVATAMNIGRAPNRRFGKLSLEQIATDPDQPRVEFDEVEIRRLASSIKKLGQLHPIRVRWNGSMSKWVIVTGERRYRATKEAGLDRIDCYFHDEEITDSEIREQQLVENLLRQDLKPMEEAKGYAALMELNQWTGKQVAEALRVSASKVCRALALLDLPSEIQDKVEEGMLAPTAAYELGKLENEQSINAIASSSGSEKLTHARTVRAVRQRKGKRNSSTRKLKQVFASENGLSVAVTANRSANYHEVEEALLQALDEVRLRIENNVQLF